MAINKPKVLTMTRVVLQAGELEQELVVVVVVMVIEAGERSPGYWQWGLQQRS